MYEKGKTPVKLPFLMRLLMMGCCLTALLQSIHAAPVRAQEKQSSMRVHRVEPGAQWGADLSPNGQSVAVATLRKVVSEESQTEEVFIDVEVWDFRANKQLAKHTVAHRPASTAVTTEWGQVRYSSDGRLLLVYDGELLNVLQAADLDEITRIDLGLPSWPRDSQVVDLAMARDAPRQVAVLLSWGGGRGGALRLYDLQTGELRREWEWDHGYPELGARVAWRPDGRKLAVTLLPVVPGQKLHREEKTLQVMDADTGKVLISVNTGYLAGPVCFRENDQVLTATAEPAWTFLFGTHKIKVWSATTGHLLRELDSAPSGVRGSLELSANERILLGYVGSERSSTSFAATYPTEIIEQRFREWDLTTGRVVATSSRLLPHADKRAKLRLNAKGNLVLVYWEYPDKPLFIYEIASLPPQTSTAQKAAAGTGKTARPRQRPANAAAHLP